MPLPFPFTVYGANRSSAPSDDCFTYCYGGDWVQGKVGNYGVKLISSDSPKNYIDINNYSDIHALQKGTISMWVNPNISGEYYPTLLGAADNAVNNTYFEFYIDHLNSKVSYAHYNAGTSNTNILNDTAITANTWSHVALTSDGTTAKVYLNGVNNTVNKSGFGNNGDWFADNSGLDNLILGIIEYNGGTLIAPYSGSMDEVAIWDVPLTDAQISLLSTGSARADSITPPNASDGAWVTGVSGSYALEFNGTSDYVAMGAANSAASNALQPSSGTYACWIKPALKSGVVMGAAYPTTSGANNKSLSMHTWVSSGDLVFYANSGDGTNAKLIYNTAHAPGGSGWTVDTWHHLAMTWENPLDDPSKLRMYVNGVYYAPGASSYDGGSSFDPGASRTRREFALGIIDRTGTPAYWDGEMDDVAVWDVVLDADAIASLMGASPSSVSSSNLISYWNMEDGPGSTTLTDQTANGYDGTLNGFSDTGTTGSLLLYYDFEIGDSNPVSGNFPANTTVYDVVTASFHPSTAHTGTMTNMSVADFGAWDQGKVGKYSLNFSGTAGVGDSVEVANNSAINFTGDMTVAGWVYSSNQSFLQGFVSKAQSSGFSHDGWLLGRDSSGGTLGAANKFTFSLRKEDGDLLKYAFSDNVGPNGGWSHLAGTFRNGTLYLYVNGVQQSDTDTLSDIGATTCAMRLGQWWDQSDAYPLVGNLDEVSIWSGSLDDTSIVNLYNGSKANDITPSASYGGAAVATLAAYYDFECNGPGSSVAKDLSGNDLNGTLTKMKIGTCGSG